MRVAVLNDIHGNLPALEAVLEEVRGVGIDRIVIGGDVFPGPMSHLVLRRLRELDVPVDFIYGNGEIAIAESLAGLTPARVPEAYLPAIRWNAEQLENAERDDIARWPISLRLHVTPIGDVLFCHATPRNEHEIFTELTPEERLIPIFEPADADLVVCGHTHMPFDRSVGRTRVVNTGSVGMPFGPPGADWLLLGPGVELRHTNYDTEAAAERIRRCGYPGAEAFAETYVRHPPAAADMLALYRQHELTP